MNKKIFFLILIITFFANFCRADEGLWLPNLIKALNYSDMQTRGLMISAEDLYSANKASMKDAVAHFNGGCTAEVVSKKGLLFTNHHCGYSQIAAHSTTEKNYLRDGFWAKNNQEELPGNGMYVDFVVKIEDVTNQIIPTGKEEEAIISQNIQKVGLGLIEGTHYLATIKPFNYGNKYFAFILERFEDVRLVGAPPSAIGKFGYDTDNWVWPRHTGDFTVFRIYADKDNRPAKYSSSNIPYTPKYYFPISLEGIEEGDFAMVYGFPGTTEQHLTSFAVKQKIEVTNPARIEMRESALEVINQIMKENEERRLLFASTQSRISNYWKKFKGESFGLRKENAVETKRDFEKKFQEKVDNNKELTKKYGHLLSNFQALYESNNELEKAYSYYFEFVNSGANFITTSNQITEYLTATENLDELSEKMLGSWKTNVIDRDLQQYLTDLLINTLSEIVVHLPPAYHPDILKLRYPTYITDLRGVISKLFSESYFTNSVNLKKLEAYKHKKKKKVIAKDEVYILMRQLYEIYKNDIIPKYRTFYYASEDLMKKYVTAIYEVFPDKNYWYDANGTLRLSYGNIKGSSPRDGMAYTHYTTAQGILEKYIPNDDEFDVPEKLLTLFRNKDYGQYAQDSNLIICFTTTSQTTGGNSGSPVINGKGHLIGINFDRSWESTMSDIMFSEELCRNITVDIRYVLFVIDKYGEAQWLIDEMDLIIKKDPLQIKRDFLEREVIMLTKLIYSSPEQADLYFKRGKVHYELGELKMALENYKKAVDLDSENKIYIEKKDFIETVIKQIESIKE